MGTKEDFVKQLETENHDLRVELEKCREKIADLQQELEICKGERDAFKNYYNSATKELEQFQTQKDELETTVRILAKLIH